MHKVHRGRQQGIELLLEKHQGIRGERLKLHPDVDVTAWALLPSGHRTKQANRLEVVALLPVGAVVAQLPENRFSGRRLIHGWGGFDNQGPWVPVGILDG